MKTLSRIEKEFSFAKCCTKNNCSKIWLKFADEFVLVFGGEDALKERK
jgi:hypothetical protein